MWMSHPAWPSTEWQLYTSDYDAHASYFGAKKACEPVHVQLNLDDRKVVIIEHDVHGDRGRARVRRARTTSAGRRIGRQALVLRAPANATTEAFTLARGARRRPAALLRPPHGSTVAGADEPLSDNFYWQARRDEDH